MLFDAPPTIAHNLQRAVDEIAAANGVSNTGYLDEVSAVTAAPVIAKYTGVLAAADVFTESTAIWVRSPASSCL